MDTQEEAMFLDILRNYSNLLSCKQKTKNINKKKADMCKEIRESYIIRTGKSMDIKQLQKRFYYIQDRVKGKLKKRSSTGGGSEVVLSANDHSILDIFGEGNPKFFEVPGGVSSSHFSTTSDPDTSDSDEESAKENLGDSSVNDITSATNFDVSNMSGKCAETEKLPISKRRRLDPPQFNELYALQKSKLIMEKQKILIEKETLLLQQQKLRLEITKLQIELGEHQPSVIQSDNPTGVSIERVYQQL